MVERGERLDDLEQRTGAVCVCVLALHHIHRVLLSGYLVDNGCVCVCMCVCVCACVHGYVYICTLYVSWTSVCAPTYVHASPVVLQTSSTRMQVTFKSLPPT